MPKPRHPDWLLPLSVVLLMAVTAVCTVYAVRRAEHFTGQYSLVMTYGPAYAQAAAQNALDSKNVGVMQTVAKGFTGQPLTVRVIDAGKGRNAQKPGLKLFLDAQAIAEYPTGTAPYDADEVAGWVLSKVSGLKYGSR